MTSFPPAQRALLNPRFEGYKLQALEESEHVSLYHLPAPTTQATVSGRSFLSFQEVANRIKHNHLAIVDHRCALYIDAQGGVHSISFYDEVRSRRRDYKELAVADDRQTDDPVFRKIFEIPQHIGVSGELASSEYPSVVPLRGGLVLIADGSGRFYLVRSVESGYALVVTAELVGDQAAGSLSPCRMHQATLAPDGSVLVVLSVKVAGPPVVASGSREGATSTRFQLLLGRIRLSHSGVEILWKRTGDDLPLRVTFDASHESLLVVSSSPYWEGDTEPSSQRTEPKPDELAPIPRADEDIDAPGLSRPPPYSWTQSEDTVTVAFPLPSIVSKGHIKVHFSPRTLSLSIQDPTGAIAENSPIPLPHYTLEEFWDGVSPAACFWTWDKAADQSYGLLSLHIDKQHENRKWMHVFARAAKGGSDDVPETMDPSELRNISESLEKYTANLGGQTGRGGLGFAGGDVPSLADDEMDEEVDGTVGQHVLISTLHVDGSLVSEKPLSSTLLSLSLPGLIGNENSFILKHGIDGTLYEPTPSGWTHSATFPAISFVLASKRDLRYIHHASGKLLLAFESGVNSSGNVYLYHGVGPKENWAGQAVLKVGGGEAGALLGVGAIQTDAGKAILVCLCESQLVLVRNIL